MVDYRTALAGDLVEQFRGKPKIEALLDVIGDELQAVYDFFAQLRQNRDLYSAIGAQLDGVGDIAVLSRAEAGEFAGRAGFQNPSEEITDEIYRRYLIYKVLKNNCDCTYPDIVKAFRMFWDKPLYYSEDPEHPATMFLETGKLSPDDHAEKLLGAPVIKAAGVGIRVTATTEFPEMQNTLYITPIMGRPMSVTYLPELEWPAEENLLEGSK